jgi:hypothetical protein
MSSAMQLVRPATTLLLLSVTVLGLINVYGDNAEVKAQAQAVACGGKECPANVIRLERNPLAQTYDIAAEPNGSRKGTVTVTIRCARTKVLLGDWECLAQK